MCMCVHISCSSAWRRRKEKGVGSNARRTMVIYQPKMDKRFQILHFSLALVHDMHACLCCIAPGRVCVVGGSTRCGPERLNIMGSAFLSSSQPPGVTLRIT